MDEFFDYYMPEELIAQEPLQARDSSRLMVLCPDNSIEQRIFSEITDYMREDDLVIINDTRVFPARLIGKKETGGEVEVLLTQAETGGIWKALCRPFRKIKDGTTITFRDGVLRGIVIEKLEHGEIRILLESDRTIDDAVDRSGQIPLPPYIRRKANEEDIKRYQTVYASNRGSVAAPTAGLHFTPDLLEKIRLKGIEIASVTLHVGIGTFRPLTKEEINKNKLHSEYCIVPASTAEKAERCRKNGGRIFAVGTTTTRALETASAEGKLNPFNGWTDIFIKPGHVFRSVDCLLTNFHLPCSSLLLLVSAFAGTERIKTAYQTAIDNRYRFYSYGDAMLILGGKN